MTWSILQWSFFYVVLEGIFRDMINNNATQAEILTFSSFLSYKFSAKPICVVIPIYGLGNNKIVVTPKSHCNTSRWNLTYTLLVRPISFSTVTIILLHSRQLWNWNMAYFEQRSTQNTLVGPSPCFKQVNEECLTLLL